MLWGVYVSRDPALQAAHDVERERAGRAERVAEFLGGKKRAQREAAGSRGSGRERTREDMGKAKRERHERTDQYALIHQWARFPEQQLYERIRPITLFGATAEERAQEISAPVSTLRRAAAAFDREGMVSLFRPTRAQRADHHRSLPVPMRQLIVDLKADHPAFTLHELATICFVQFGRRPSHHTVKDVLADGPRPSQIGRRYPVYAEIADAAERRLVIIRLHAAGWTVTSISAYLQVSRKTIYALLKRWVAEGVRGLDDKSHANTHRPPTVPLRTRQTIRQLQENPGSG